MRVLSKISVAAPTLAALGALTAPATVQAQSIAVGIVGKIIPGACTLNINNGGVIDYGDIPAHLLNPTDYTVLPEQHVPLTMQCNAPIKLALKSVDNRTSSMIPGITQAIHPDYYDPQNFGLGTVSGVKVGGYVMRTTRRTFTADGHRVEPVLSIDDGNNWVKFGGSFTTTGKSLTSWSIVDGGTPTAFRDLRGSVLVHAVLNKGDELPLADGVPLNGSATLELKYL